MAITFDIPGIPAPQGSKRHLGNGILVESSKRLKPWRTDVREAARAAIANDWPFDAAFSLTITFRYPRPKSHLRTNGTLKPSAPPHLTTRTGDIDKLCRSILDALTGVLYLDDSQIISLFAAKRYTIAPELPGALVTINPQQAT
jgi:crossover junction endodeoxyribonuclease RusA